FGGPTAAKPVRTNLQGQFEFRNLDPGAYTLRVTAKGFAPAERQAIAVTPTSTQTVDFALVIAAESERVTVTDQIKVDTDPSGNASALVLRGKELEALS